MLPSPAPPRLAALASSALLLTADGFSLTHTPIYDGNNAPELEPCCRHALFFISLSWHGATLGVIFGDDPFSTINESALLFLSASRETVEYFCD